MKFVLIILFLSFYMSNALYSNCNDEYKDTVFHVETFKIGNINIRTLGDAGLDNGLLYLAGQQVHTSSAAWLRPKINVSDGFITEIEFSVLDNSNGYTEEYDTIPGADGFAFVIQNESFDSRGGAGHALGYDGISNSIAVEVDMYENSSRTNNNSFTNDPNSNHIGVLSKGTNINRSSHSDAHLGLNKDIIELQSDNTHYFLRIIYNNELNTFDVCLAEEDREFVNVIHLDNFDIKDLLDLDEGQAIVGFTSGCGGILQRNFIHTWTWLKERKCHELMFEYVDFADVYDLNFVGKSNQYDNAARLTPAKTLQTGAMWHSKPVPVKKGFTTEFRFRMLDGSNGSSTEGSYPGADGIAFVIQNTSLTEMGSYGGGLGYEGIGNSIAVEYDMYNNHDAQIITKHDQNGNHISVHTGGHGLNSSLHDPNYEMGTVWDLLEMKSDGIEYWSKIRYRDSGRLDIYLSENRSYDKPVLSLDGVDISSILNLREEEFAYVGFTSATASAYQVHDILYWYFCPDETDAILGIEEEATSNNLQIFPNPASNELTINSGAYLETKLRIYNQLGQKVYEDEIIGTTEIDISSMTSGAYYIVLETAGNYKFEQFNIIR